MIYILAPDRGSGNAFNKVLLKNGINTYLKIVNIAPRVIDNKINTSSKVVKDLEKAILKIPKEYKYAVIACNTLQFWLNQIDNKYSKNLKIFTTIEACDFWFKKSKEKPVWIGTTPTSQMIKTFSTPVTINLPNVQNLTQELTWRIKMLNNDDINTASEKIKRDKNNLILQKIKIFLLKYLIIFSFWKKGIKDVILGCTEYPIVFDKKNQFGINFYDPAEILANYIRLQKMS